MIYMWGRPVFFYNAYFFNMGNWAVHIPGWVNPTAKLEPEPVIFICCAYLWFTTLGSMCTVWSMRWLRARLGGVNGFQLCCFGFATIFCYDILVECSWIKSGLYADPAVIHHFAIWGGKSYQFPLNEAIC